MTKEEVQAIMAEELRMDAKAAELTEAERLHIMDMGYYNDALRGYLILAMQDAGFGPEDVTKALRAFHGVLDDTSAAEAAEVYRKF